MLSRFATHLIRLLIGFYQKLLSPLLKAALGTQGSCRFHPTCSHYFLQAVEIHGPLRGSWLGVKRLLRCQPWGGFGEDPVPPCPDHHSH